MHFKNTFWVEYFEKITYLIGIGHPKNWVELILSILNFVGI